MECDLPYACFGIYRVQRRYGSDDLETRIVTFRGWSPWETDPWSQWELVTLSPPVIPQGGREKGSRQGG